MVADIVDPHDPGRADALPTLRCLAKYAETHAKTYRRIEAIAKDKGRFRVLAMTPDDIRNAVAGANTAASLYGSAFAGNYA